MRKKEMWATIIFYGAVWGFLEATLGHALHFVPIYIAGLIMFPIASGILIRVYTRFQQRGSLFAVGVVAAAIKLVDILLPGLPVMKTVNPIIAILLEAVIVAVAYPLLMNTSIKKKITGAVLATVSWRAIFVAYMYAGYMVTGELAKWVGTSSQAINFIVMSGLVEAIFVVLAVSLVAVRTNVDTRKHKVRLSYALTMTVLAIGMTLIF